MFELLFGGVFLFVICMFAYQLVRGVAEWDSNNHSPIEKRAARVTGKRGEIHRHHHTDANGMPHMSTSTTYYVTFEFEDGARIELRVKGREFGLLAENDRGTLTYQGTRYLGFLRL